jgi:hypothetical protein
LIDAGTATTVLVVMEDGSEQRLACLDTRGADLTLLDALMRLMLHARRRGGRVRLLGPSAELRRLLVLTGLHGALAGPPPRTDARAPSTVWDAGAMTPPDDAWEHRLADAWAQVERVAPERFRALIEVLVDELPSNDAVGLFELASANDSTGQPEVAAPLYRQALAEGLDGERRRRAVIQLASTLRNLGRPQDSVTLLEAELGAEIDGLQDAVKAFLALAYVDLGREREAVGLALDALAHHLPRYNRSLARYAADLTEAPATEGDTP